MKFVYKISYYDIRKYIYNPLTKGEGMKTFINAARIAAVALLFVSLSSFSFGLFGGRGCCPKRACPETRCATNGCKLPIQPVTIRKTCDHPGYVKQVCHLEYEPCEGKVEEVTATPIFIGCFDEQGNQVN